MFFLHYMFSHYSEGVLKPGYDLGAGYFSELDAPSISAPNNEVYQRFG